jgi:hypothetical protein
MKKQFINLFGMGGLILLLISSCKKNEAVVTSNGGQPGSLTANSTTLVLDKTRLNDTSKVVQFSFSAANFGFSAAVTNTLQIDPVGDNWAKPTSVTLPNKVFTQGYSTNDFNNLVLRLNLPAGKASAVNVRVMQSISTSLSPVYSNTLSLTVTPFNLISYVYVPGAYEGWSNPGPQEDSLVSLTGNGIYTGIINFTAGNNQFLIVPVKGSWANKYATTQNPGTGTTATYSTELVSSGGNNFYAPTTAGQYLVTFNANNSTLTIVPADFYTIIGSSTPGGNWSTDLYLKFINDGNNNWVGTFSLLAGQFKVRQDAAWGISYGLLPTPDGKTLTDSNGGNINAPTAGTYTVSFTAPPTSFGSPALTTTTYSIQ